MHNDSRLVDKRIEHVRTERVAPARYFKRVPLALVARQVPDEPVAVSTAWGRPSSTMWLCATGTVPAQWACERVEPEFDLGSVGKWPGGQAEALVHDEDGHPTEGVAPRNQYVPIAAQATGEEPVSLPMEAAANPATLADGPLATQLGGASPTQPRGRTGPPMRKRPGILPASPSRTGTHSPYRSAWCGQAAAPAPSPSFSTPTRPRCRCDRSRCSPPLEVGRVTRGPRPATVPGTTQGGTTP